MQYPIFSNDIERVEKIRRYAILDTAWEKSPENLTLPASRVCDAPIAAIRVLDRHQAWFKSLSQLSDNAVPA